MFPFIPIASASNYGFLFSPKCHPIRPGAASARRGATRRRGTAPRSGRRPTTDRLTPRRDSQDTEQESRTGGPSIRLLFCAARAPTTGVARGSGRSAPYAPFVFLIAWPDPDDGSHGSRTGVARESHGSRHAGRPPMRPLFCTELIQRESPNLIIINYII